MEEEKKENQDNKKFKNPEKNLTNKIRENPWMLATIVVSVLCLILIITSISGGITGKVISKNEAGEKLLNFYKSLGVNGLKVDSVEEVSGLYKVNFDYDNSIISFYVTKDGKQFFPSDAGYSLSSLSSSSSSEETTCWTDIADKLGMDSQKIESFAFSSDGISLLKMDSSLADDYSVSGSPTLFINGEESDSVYYGTESMKSAICSVFTTLPPECKDVKINSSIGIPKSQKPVVELFVMSYCPYGVNAENNILPLVKLFSDKVEFKVRFITSINGNTISSVNSLHGEKEAKEDARQIAIMKLYPESFWDYLKEFNSKCYGSGSSSASSGSC